VENETAMQETGHQHSHPNYVLIFYWLVGLTAATYLAAPLKHAEIFTEFLVIIWVLAIACSKASLVAMFFMHLKFEGRWKFVLVVPPLVMACVLVLALVPDIAVRIYKP
jgi:cytochrome c oxidase subunit 4